MVNGKQRTEYRYQKNLTPDNYQSQVTNYQLPITNYQLPITNYQLPITNYQLPLPNPRFRFQVPARCRTVL